MKRGLIGALVLTGMLLAYSAVLRAEVKTEEKSQFKLEGMMGRMMGMFGGKAAKEGVINTVAVKGNRKVTASEDSSEIIDLDEQKIYNLNLKKKTYEVVTFAEMRRRLQETQEKAAKAARDENREAKQPENQKQPEDQMEIDFSLKESGQKRNINGYDCREVVMTITARQKGKTLEQAGGMVMTSHIWLGPNIPATKEIAEFDQRYAKAMEGVFGPGASADQMAMATAMYPGMKDMIGKMQVESVNMQGAQILTETTMESVKSQEQMSQQSEQKQESSGMSGLGGIGGMLGRRIARKKEPEGGSADKPSNRSTIMTMNHELLKVSTTVDPSELAIPAGFKEKK
jgi:hypothetical protein